MIKKGEAIMNNSLTIDEDYSAWLKELKNKVRLVQIKAAVKVNSELLLFYWDLGTDIVEKQKNTKWGAGFLKQLSIDLSSEFPDTKGFSLSNLKYIKQWYLFYSQEIEKSQQAVGQISSQVLSQSEKSFGQQAVTQLTQIPWGHNITKNLSNANEFISSLPDIEEIEAELSGGEESHE